MFYNVNNLGCGSTIIHHDSITIIHHDSITIVYYNNIIDDYFQTF